MASSERSTLILVAVIGVIGTLGAAAITNPSILIGEDKKGSAGDAGSGATPPSLVAARSPIKGITPPHAREIRLNQSTEVWGENTKVLEIPPGEEREVDGRNLFASIATFPQGNCLGPEYIAFNWQVRDPYPEGGDLEVKQVFQGGSTVQVGMGAMGSGQMGPCEIRIFKNNGLVPTKVEIRYASAIDRDAMTFNASPEAAIEEAGVAEAAIENPSR
jgi:hypothetical protein